MDQLADGWEVVSRRTIKPARGLWLILLDTLLGGGAVASAAPSSICSPACWTLRHTATGQVRSVTASSVPEAREKIAQGQFDKL
jgi:hypothetical protein